MKAALATVRAMVGRDPSVLLMEAGGTHYAARLREVPQTVTPGDYLQLEVAMPADDTVASTECLQVVAIVKHIGGNTPPPRVPVLVRTGLRLQLEVARISRGWSNARISVPRADSLQRAVAQAHPSGVIGKLGDIALPDVLQLLELSGKTARVDIKPRGRTDGRIYLDHGHVVHAEYEGTHGEEAFFRLARATHGYFRIRFGREPPMVSLHQPTTALLLEATRRADESQRATPPVTDITILGEALPEDSSPPIHPLDSSRLANSMEALAHAERTFASLQAALAFIESGDPALHEMAVAQSCPSWPNSQPPHLSATRPSPN